MALRYYANAPATTLALSCSSSSTTITVDSVSGLPIQYPYTLILDHGLPTEEVVSVTNASGAALTVIRGADSTTAFSHVLGAPVVHGISAQDPREANIHVNATSGVHGTSSAVVGTTDSQTLTNKTIGASNTINGFTPSRLMVSDGAGKLTSGATAPAGNIVGDTDAQTLTNKTINTSTLGASNTINGFTASRVMQSDGSGRLAVSPSAMPTGTVVGTTDSQTLTNKDLSSATNTLPATVVTTSGSQTLTNKTITSPIIAGNPAFTGSGFISMPAKIQAGSANISTTLNTNVSTTINFGVAFPGQPVVVAIPFAQSAQFLSCVVDNVSQTGFTLRAYRTGGSAVNDLFYWIAVY